MCSSTDVTAVKAWGLSALRAVQKGGLWSMMAAGLMCMLSACSTPTQSAVPAIKKVEETPKDRYAGQVHAMIEKKWKFYRAQSPNDRAYGTLQVIFSVGPEGKVEHIHVKNNKDTDPVLTKFTVKAIQDAKLPPMPAAVVEQLKKEDEKWLELGVALNLNERTKVRLTMLMAMRWGLPLQAAQTGKSQTPSKARAAAPKLSKAEAQMPPKERYTRQVLAMVDRKWHLYRRQQKSVHEGSLLAEFYVNEQGKMEDLLVLDDRDSNRALTEFTLQAIRDAEIPPMPADVIPLLPKKDRGRLKIEYHVLIY